MEGDLKNTDDDLKAVTNLFDQILKFINDTYKEFEIAPQVIISDHADNLELKQGTFEDYVRRRWRKNTDGLIDLSKLTQSDLGTATY